MAHFLARSTKFAANQGWQNQTARDTERDGYECRCLCSRPLDAITTRCLIGPYRFRCAAHQEARSSLFFPLPTQVLHLLIFLIFSNRHEEKSEMDFENSVYCLHKHATPKNEIGYACPECLDISYQSEGAVCPTCSVGVQATFLCKACTIYFVICPGCRIAVGRNSWTTHFYRCANTVQCETCDIRLGPAEVESHAAAHREEERLQRISSAREPKDTPVLQQNTSPTRQESQPTTTARPQSTKPSSPQEVPLQDGDREEQKIQPSTKRVERNEAEGLSAHVNFSSREETSSPTINHPTQIVNRATPMQNDSSRMPLLQGAQVPNHKQKIANIKEALGQFERELSPEELRAISLRPNANQEKPQPAPDKMTCAYCSRKMTRSELREHQKTCPPTAKCEYCHQDQLLKDIEDHMQRCGNHDTPCKFCGQPARRRLMPLHLESCLQRKNPGRPVFSPPPINKDKYKKDGHNFVIEDTNNTKPLKTPQQLRFEQQFDNPPSPTTRDPAPEPDLDFSMFDPEVLRVIYESLNQRPQQDYKPANPEHEWNDINYQRLLDACLSETQP